MDESSNVLSLNIEDKRSEDEQTFVEKFFKMWDDLKTSKNINEDEISRILNEINNEDLLEIVKEIKEQNSNLSKENGIYEFFLEKGEVQNLLQMSTFNQESISASNRLSCPEKCFFAQKKLESLSEKLEEEKRHIASKLQDLQCQLESLNLSLTALKQSEEDFDKNVLLGGRHPVTKKVILQKVAKYFDDSIQNKMAQINRHKTKIQSYIMENKKLKDQIKAQKRRMISLDLLKFQECQIHFDKSNQSVEILKTQLSNWKAKSGCLIQNVTIMKKTVDKENVLTQKLKETVQNKEEIKDVIATEKARNQQKMNDLEVAMRKIQLDPRRHGLPQVIEYVLVKRQNEQLKQSLKKWKTKVDLIEQAKLIHLETIKKNMK